MGACDVLTSLLLRRVPPSDDWEPARLGVLDAIIPDEGANLRNLQLRQNGHNLLASPESRLCISNAIANTIAAAGLAHLLRVSGLRQMCRSYRTRSPEWRGDKEQDGPLSSRHSGGRTGGPSVTKIARYLGYGRRPSSEPGPWSRRPEDEPEPSGHGVLSRCAAKPA